MASWWTAALIYLSDSVICMQNCADALLRLTHWTMSHWIEHLINVVFSCFFFCWFGLFCFVGFVFFFFLCCLPSFSRLTQKNSLRDSNLLRLRFCSPISCLSLTPSVAHQTLWMVKITQGTSSPQSYMTCLVLHDNSARLLPRALKTAAEVGETQCDRKLQIMLRQICLFSVRLASEQRRLGICI